MVFIHLNTDQLLDFYYQQLFDIIQVKDYFQARNRLLILTANYNLYEEIHWHTIPSGLKYQIREAISHTADKIYAIGYLTPYGR